MGKQELNFLNTVEQVVRMGLCSGCGACAAICPIQSVQIIKDEKRGVYKPVISQKCNECGLCLKVCFGIGKSNHPMIRGSCYDPIVGNFQNCFAGSACDPDVRHDSSSGGIVTALLTYLLEEGIVDGALVTKMNYRDSVESRPFIAVNKQDLVLAARSKYCPAPVDIGLKTIFKRNGRYAVVGLPCHIYGARKAEELCTRLANKVLFHIGLFCSGTPSFLATEYLLRGLGIKKEEIERIEYRGFGWPGKMSLEFRNPRDGKKRCLLVPYPEYWKGLETFFFLHRCTLCDDGFNKLADVSCGDAWLPEYSQDNLGTSLIITRNEIGEKLVEDAYRKNYIRINKVDLEKVKHAQKSMIRFKVYNLPIRMRVQELLRRPLPSVDYADARFGRELDFFSKLSAYAFSNFFYLIRAIASKRFSWRLLDIYTKLRSHRKYPLSKSARATSVFWRKTRKKASNSLEHKV